MTIRSIHPTVRLLVAVIVLSIGVSAQTYSAKAFAFVGTAAQCSPSPAGNKIITAAWTNGMGLPDNGTANPGGSTPHQGLVLSKNGPTPNCSAAGADIVGWTGGNTLSAIGFDYRLGGHCAAGAVRINVYSGANTYFFGCQYGAASGAPQDPTNWTRVIFNVDDAYPGAEGFQFGVTPVDAIQIIMDEGTDTAGPDEPAGIGLAVLDNVRINNTLITKKAGNPVLP